MFLKKYHKRSRTNSKKSSTLSHVSHEEEKTPHSENSASSYAASSRKSSTTLKKKLSKAEKLGMKYAEKYDLEDLNKDSPDKLKKVVHFDD